MGALSDVQQFAVYLLPLEIIDHCFQSLGYMSITFNSRIVPCNTFKPLGPEFNSILLALMELALDFFVDLNLHNEFDCFVRYGRSCCEFMCLLC